MQREPAVDILRGLAILGMVYSGSVAFGGTLPAWMYHAQMPPPAHQFNPDVPGITWVDLVFPLFLFIMGVSFPLAARKIRGSKKWVIKVAQRGIFIAFLALAFQHLKPILLASEPAPMHWVAGMIGFIFLFLTFNDFSRMAIRFSKWIPWAGMLLTAGYIFLLGYWFDFTPDLYKSDIILIVLANAAFFGGMIWWLTRNNLWLRASVVLILILIRLAHPYPGLGEQIWTFSLVPWLYQFSYLQYLVIVLSGTVAGEWIRDHAGNFTPHRLDGLIALSTFLLGSLVLYGLFTRQVEATFLLSLFYFLIIGYVFYRQKRRLMFHLAILGSLLLIFGLIVEPVGGGIKKDPGTLSYYFVTAGLSVWLLAGFILQSRSEFFLKIWKPVQLVGMNPLLAYVLPALMIWPAIGLMGLNLEFFNNTPLLGLLKGLVITIPVILVTAFFSKKKWFWKT